jgi:hypothetical protein
MGFSLDSRESRRRDRREDCYVVIFPTVSALSLRFFSSDQLLAPPFSLCSRRNLAAVCELLGKYSIDCDSGPAKTGLIPRSSAADEVNHACNKRLSFKIRREYLS